jgi:putative endonuclease
VRQQTYVVRVYYVYMLRCFDGTFYTGITNDIVRRFAEHCMGYKPSSYTHTRRPVLLVYAGEFQRPDEAIAFEKQLKHWSHKKKRAFADREWPLLKRLAIGSSPAVPRSGGPSTPLGMTNEKRSPE